MIREKLPKDLNFVPPTDVIIEAIEDLERAIRKQNTTIAEMEVKIAKLKRKIPKDG